LNELVEHPKTGTGKPELLTGNLNNYWSRRINKKDRLIYRINDEMIIIYILVQKDITLTNKLKNKMSTEKIIEYYNQLASEYDENRFGNSYGQFIDFQERRILNKIFKKQSGKILDLACGSGRLTNFATSGADASEEMLKIAQKKHSEKEFFQAKSNELPFEKESFQGCLTFHFIMHLDEVIFTKPLMKFTEFCLKMELLFLIFL
jgi:2-polyprenyl-3-methyl-5-hydroxy-6-metoxy-1,4-benzoquinol methylase